MIGSVILFAPFILLPFLVAIIYRFTKKSPQKWTYTLTYMLLMCYFIIVVKLEYANTESPTEGWFLMYLPFIFLIVTFVITPLSLGLQSIFFRILLKKGRAIGKKSIHRTK